jgi:peptidoglycan/xylan/chitin deacetylase (PgdA/CDA1 family)
MKENRQLPNKVAVITFDDGYKDNYTYAFPILKKYNVPATIFLTTGYLNNGKLFWFDLVRYILWNTKLKQIELDNYGIISLNTVRIKKKSINKFGEYLKKIPDEKKNYLIKRIIKISKLNIPHNLGKDIILTWEEVKEMNQSGIDFGAHTLTHPILTRISKKKAMYEIIQSKKEIEKRLGKEVTTFCYPNGDYYDFNTDIIEIVKESGFICAVSSISRKNPSKKDLYSLGRISPWNYDSFKYFASGIYYDTTSILNLFTGKL